VELRQIMPDFGFSMYLPTEPVLFGILILFILKVIHEREFDKKILLHPVSVAIYLNLIWIFLTSLTSSMPMVSFKFLLARIWFVVAFFFLTTKIFSYRKQIEQYIYVNLYGYNHVILYSIRP